MEIVIKKTDELIPYINNPRSISDEAVDKVASSIKNFGFKVPIIIDENDEIVAGHTRLKASKKLGLEEVPCIIADDLTDEQVKAFRIADNRVSEESEWDWELLETELSMLDEFNATDLGFEVEEISDDIDEMLGEEEDTYTSKIEIPNYEPTGEKPDVVQLYDDEKANELIKRIEKSKIPKEEKEFLKLAAYRHVVFDYRNIAEYYAHSDKEIQELMEESALVIIDFDKAIEQGFIEFTTEVMESIAGEEDEEIG